MQPFKVMKDIFLKGTVLWFSSCLAWASYLYFHVFLLREKASGLEPRLGCTVRLCGCTFKQLCSYGSATNAWGMKMLLLVRCLNFYMNCQPPSLSSPSPRPTPTCFHLHGTKNGRKLTLSFGLFSLETSQMWSTAQMENMIIKTPFPLLNAMLLKGVLKNMICVFCKYVSGNAKIQTWR